VLSFTCAGRNALCRHYDVNVQCYQQFLMSLCNEKWRTMVLFRQQVYGVLCTAAVKFVKK
jgi:hypothetical protein